MKLWKVVLAGLAGAGAILFLHIAARGLSTAKGRGALQTPVEGPISDSDLKTVTISLERRPCYGSCPEYSVVIHGEGQIEYAGKSHVKETGTRETRIEIEKVRNLASEFAKAKFETIGDEYSEPNCKGRICTDFPTVIVELVASGKRHKVTHYHGCGSAAKVLFELEAAVDKTAGSERWTGDVSHAGPYGTTCFEGK